MASPLLRSTAQRNRLPFSATFRKMRSPQIIGVDPDHVGIGSFHAMFSVADHFTGRFVSVLMPFNEGPRHCGQFSARVTPMMPRVITIVAATVRIVFIPFRFSSFVTIAGARRAG